MGTPWTGGGCTVLGVAIGPALNGSRVGPKATPRPRGWPRGRTATPQRNFVSKKSQSFPSRDYPPRSSSPSSSNAVELPIRPWSCHRSRGPAWGSGWEEDFWFGLVFFFLSFWRLKELRKEDDSVFCQHLLFLCFFCSMLISQLLIGGQKGVGFCHHRIEVILNTHTPIALKFYKQLDDSKTIVLIFCLKRLEFICPCFHTSKVSGRKVASLLKTTQKWTPIDF
jgi:hypothetical protein